MNKFQLLLHHIFRFVWNALFILSYPIMATFGILFVGITYVFSGISKSVMWLRPADVPQEIDSAGWASMASGVDVIEGKIHKQFLFGPVCYRLRRTDGIPSALEEHVFGNKIKVLEEGILLEKWNSTELKELPDFDICIYTPDNDSLVKIVAMKCFDWHLADKETNQLLFKWFDGTQGGELRVAL